MSEEKVFDEDGIPRCSSGGNLAGLFSFVDDERRPRPVKSTLVVVRIEDPPPVVYAFRDVSTLLQTYS